MAKQRDKRMDGAPAPAAGRVRREALPEPASSLPEPALVVPAAAAPAAPRAARRKPVAEVVAAVSAQPDRGRAKPVPKRAVPVAAAAPQARDLEQHLEPHPQAPPTAVLAETVPIAVPEPKPNGHGFRDLLGQAVGLRLDGVGRVFRMGEVKVPALSGISFEVAPGEFVAIAGPSGCGKSTLLGLLGGLDRPTSGHVYAAGTALDELPESGLADYRLQRVGTVFQTFNLIPTLNALDNVALPLAFAGVPEAERRERARRLLELVGLAERAHFRPGRLSGGEQQRVAVARALANRPGLILADEPTGNLDSANGKVVLELLEELNRRGATVILVTHDPEIAKRARRVVRLRDGRVETARSPRRTGRAPETLDPPTRLSSRDALRLGLGSVGRRPLRTALTAAGVAIGIGVMSLILALASGLQHQVVDSVAAQGQLQQVQVLGGASDAGGRRALDPASLKILGGLHDVHAAWGEVEVEGTLTPAGVAPGDATPLAVLASLPPRQDQPALAGRLLVSGRQPASDSAGQVVISQEQARRLGWTSQTALGKQVTFNGQYPGVVAPGSALPAAAAPVALTLTVVGVSPGSPLGGDLQGGLIPYKTAQTYWSQLAQANRWTQDEFASVTLLADSISHVDTVRDEARAAGFPAQTAQDQLRGVEELLRYLDLALVGLAAIALAVACLGIVNTMYTAVLEQTRAIGVFKALGARSRDVTLLFVAEAGVIGATAGLIGVAAAFLIAWTGNRVINNVAQSQGADLNLQLFAMGPLIVVGGLLLAVALSVLSGLLPAIRAARLDPVSALRYE